MESSNKRITWYGHNCFLFECFRTRFLIDPFLLNGLSPVDSQNIFANYILVSHGHADHCSDALTIAKNSDATIVAIAEIADYYYSQKHVKTEAINIGGILYPSINTAHATNIAQILAVQAPHSSTMPDGKSGGNSLGFILSFSQNGVSLSPNDSQIKPLKETLESANAFNVYFACDTGLFSEMEWIGRIGIDLAILPIGGKFTMGPSISLDAVNLIKPRYVIPSHYNTWEPIIQNVENWQKAIKQYTDSIPLILTPGITAQELANGSWNNNCDFNE